MSNYLRWIDADKLMERWGIGSLDLTDYVLESKLIAYTRDKKPHRTYYDLLDDEQLSFEWIEVDEKIERAIGTYVYFGDRVNEFIFRFSDILQFEKELSENYQNLPNNEEKPMRNDQRHKERCRALAGYLWEKHPDTTIKDMIQTDALIKYGCENRIPRYHEKTLRKWIHDLCPNNKPGRRPKSE
jgi:hypothetical protein